MKRCAGVLAVVVGLGAQAHAQAWTQPPAVAPAAPVVVEEAAAAATLMVAVLDLKGGAGAESKASALTTMLTSEVSAQANRRAISRNELQGLLTQQATAQLVGCDDPRCMADVAKLANADEVIAGTVEKLEGATVIGLSLMRTDGPDGPQIVARQKAAWRGSDDELLLVVRPLVQRLFDAQHAHEHVGGLSLFAPAGSSVVVDGTALGTAPITPIAALPTGVHRVQVSQAGYVTGDMDVVIARNETTISRVELVAEPITSQPWFWAATSGVALAAAGGVGAVVYFVSTNSADTRAVLGTPK
jgi:hypothetical protein